ncbi:hypothetical protein [Nocardioides marmorisolisilvae]|uniref:DUF1877 family protein n=1 Tax=Nocardioides marmorisolisilvae TaxID=1542737 RepID=A0A3N0DSH4_9ACTN|nr:hypothetical protein [Nocardioides marmorisolisilvae]RNL78461.1 hypothetical protein EFL95_05035 [Nocardioides marmorisolisilvae]
MITEYFMASDDDAAAETIDRTGGPSAPPDAAEESAELFGRRAPDTRSAISYSVLDGNGIEPTVQLSSLEALLTGRDIDELFDEHDAIDLVIASRDGGEGLVVRLPDALTRALERATETRLREVAVPWSQTEEFWGDADPSDLAEWLIDLADFVREGSGETLYCWVSV